MGPIDGIAQWGWLSRAQWGGRFVPNGA